MTDCSVAESGELQARFIFPEDFLGFRGHFPGNKILPGICQIQCALSLLEKCRGERAVLKEIILAKFISPVLPAEELICRAGNTAEESGSVILKASFSRDGKKVSEIKLRVQVEKDIKPE